MQPKIRKSIAVSGVSEMLLKLIIVVAPTLFSGCGGFNPFMDNDLHMIDWVGAGVPKETDNVVIMKTAANEKYSCVLPQTADSTDESLKKEYDGPSPEELMENMFTTSTCSYRIESYWTYELCHGRYLRQYHEEKEKVDKKPNIQEYFLGYFGKSGQKKGSKVMEPVHLDHQEIRTKRIDGIDLPYYEVNMTDGTLCPLINEPRRTRILYVCQPEGRGEIFGMKETSTCEYEVMVLTATLCRNPLFKPKNPPVNKIFCHAMDGAPVRPKNILHFDSESPASKETYSFMVDDDDVNEDVDDFVRPPPQPPQQKPAATHVDTTLSATTDKQVLRDFLSGDHCLQGGTGWWKHEFCFGKYARQFHDSQEGRTVIHLGFWNEKKHLDWVMKNPSKLPKAKSKRKSLSLLYTDGDVCDVTGKKRLSEVRLKCVENPEQPHSVSIYLIEPRTCEYVFGIESHLFCSILDRADDYGLIKNLEV